MSSTYIQWPPTEVPTFTNQAALPIPYTDGALAVTLDTYVVYVFDGQTQTWLPTGGTSVPLAIGTIDGQAPSANGAAIALNQLFMQSASATNPGLVNNTTQTFSGAKTLTSALSLSSHQIHNVTDPTVAQDAATKAYVDLVASKLNPIQAVYAASTVTIVGTYNNGAAGVGATFTVTATGVFTIDGTTPPTNSRILLKDQTSGFQNGVYDLTNPGSVGVSPILTRSADYDTPASINAGDLVPVINGTANTQTSWLQTATVTTVGTDPLVFVLWTANPASYLKVANNLSDVASPSASFNNISPMTTLGDTIYGFTAGAGTRLAGNTTATKQFLSQTGTGSVSAAPVWSSISSGDLPTITLTGDVTGASAGGTIPTTLATVNANTGTWGTSSAVGTFTVNAKGLITAASNTPIAISLTGDATGTYTTGTIPVTFATVNGNVGTFGTASSVGTFTVNAKGLTTAASNTPIAIDFSQVTTGTVPIAQGGTGQTTKTTGFDALSPMTTGGDIIYGGASGTGTRLPNGTSGQVLTSNGTTLAPSWQTNSASTPTSSIRLDDASNSFGSSETHVKVFATVTTSVGTDLTYNADPVNGDNITVNTTGNYSVWATSRSSGTDEYQISKNTANGMPSISSADTIVYTDVGVSNIYNSMSNSTPLTSGDVLRFASANRNLSGQTSFQVTRVS